MAGTFPPPCAQALGLTYFCHVYTCIVLAVLRVPGLGYGYAIPAQMSSTYDTSWLRPLVVFF